MEGNSRYYKSNRPQLSTIAILCFPGFQVAIVDPTGEVVVILYGFGQVG
jgi:hypothetical protein